MGCKIGSYTVVRPLGRGGMAEVYDVENERLGARFALKLFTLDHRWRKVIPDLLGNDPKSRVCEAWWKGRRPLRAVSGEKNANEIILRIRFSHRMIGVFLLVAGLLFVVLALLAVQEHGQRCAAERRLDAYRLGGAVP